MHTLNSLWAFFHLIPFTIVLLSLIIAVGAWTRICREALSHHQLEKFGFAPKDLWDARWGGMFSSLFFTNNRKSFIQALILISAAVGWTEVAGGTFRAVVTFWGIHLITLVVLSLFVIFPLHKLKITLGEELALVKDVGPSAGYFGCLGCAVQSLPMPWAWLFGFAVLGGLLIYSLAPPGQGESIPVKRHADGAHIIAFVLGISTDLLWPMKCIQEIS